MTRHAELSPEVAACEWLDGATGPAVGARFCATNVVPGGRWKNRPVVTVVEPDRIFAFARTEPFAGTVAWQWTLEPVEEGTRVTIGYEVVRPVRRLGWFVIEKRFECGDRRVELGHGMQESLVRLAELAAAEEASQPAG